MKHRYIITALLWLALVPLLAGCSRAFTIKGNIKGVGSQMLRVVYYTPQGVKDAQIPASADRFEFKAPLEADDWTLVYLYDMQSQVVARFAVERGSTVKVRGDLGQRHRLEVKGPDVDEQWYKFMAEHAALYDSPDHSQLDRLIEKQAASHPGDLLSTLLVLCDYSKLNNAAQASRLLAGLTHKPAGLMAAYTAIHRRVARKAASIGSLLFYESGGDYAAFDPATAQASLLCLWTGNSGSLAQQAAQLKQWSSAYGSRLLLADVCLDADTSAWRGTIAAAGGTWKHYWAPAGPLDRQLLCLDIQSTPLYVVTDARGKIVYNGDQPARVAASLARLLK